jgi:hypothetical protein
MFDIYPANLIRLTYSRYEYVCANTIGVVMVSSYWSKFAALCLFVETMLIFNAVATGNRNNELYNVQRNGTFKLEITLLGHNARP